MIGRGERHPRTRAPDAATAPPAGQFRLVGISAGDLRGTLIVRDAWTPTLGTGGLVWLGEQVLCITGEATDITDGESWPVALIWGQVADLPAIGESAAVSVAETVTGTIDDARIREAIAARLLHLNCPENTIGTVHDHEVYCRKEGDLLRCYKAPGRDELNGWYVRRTGQARGALNPFLVETGWRARGFYALGEEGGDGVASELAFDDQVDRVIGALRSPWDAELPVPDLPAEVPVSWVSASGWEMESAPVLFAGVLCHSAIVEFRTAHIETC